MSQGFRFKNLAYSVAEIQQIIGAELLQPAKESQIDYLLTDSRSLSFPQQTLFFALPGPRRNGCAFIGELYDKGVKNFVVNQKDDVDVYTFPKANFLFVENVLKALQLLAQAHRKKFAYPVIGITGSNGKTIIKEWLYQLLSLIQNCQKP